MRSGGRKRRGRATVITTVGVVAAVVVGGGVAAVVWMNRTAEKTFAKAHDTTIAHPLTPAQQMVADADDLRACAVTFRGDGAPAEPMLQRQDERYQGLPIPQLDGRVFAGWYVSADAAAVFAVEGRVNGADPVVCAQQQVELFAAWTTPEANADAGVRIPILMYHQFTADPEGAKGWLRGNHAYIGDFEAHMNHIATTGFYLPTWDELSAFIDGRLSLPPRSVIITDDDADQSWFDLAVPVVDRYKLLSTSFMVTAYRQDPAPSVYVQRRSHTHDMHQPGDDGKGRMVNWTADQIAADLSTSGDVLGVREVVAYPFGHFNDTSKQGVAQAGYELGRTIEPGYVEIGTDKLALPVVRIDYGMGLDALVSRIG
ncbi:polysaccharide deacetylase family protein [Zhihengliuella sp. ISTPL4]|uniref:polysaccharide deacetylase family protein n=1 Tax=Zhihengliuella sp. ISTPL4 TaxID=2058657 RepID=UPI000C7ACBA6|nr:polysaccharide deacetylase family protein [Zhihengliuella sp. ISTPL4]